MARRKLISYWVCLVLLFIGLPINAQVTRPGRSNPRDNRITSLLVQLADQVRSSEDLGFSVRAQSQVANMLWPYDRERARGLFRRAFDSLAPSADDIGYGKSASVRQEVPALPPIVRRQLRVDLINQIAGNDPELAEEFARALAYSTEASKEAGASQGADQAEEREQGVRTGSDVASLVAVSTRGEAERRELLVNVALQIVERDPYRAMTLGQLSLTSGISPQFARLLMLMRGVDHGLADLLFSSAVARLERAHALDLVGVRTLGSYLVSLVNSAARDSIPRTVTIRFLDLAYNQVMLHGQARLMTRETQPADRTAGVDESDAAYFIGRQMTELFARYLPDRLAQLQRKIAEISDASVFEGEFDPSWLQPAGPADTAREARAAADERERNGLYARAALGWLAKGEIVEAQSAASRISDIEMRDKVLAQIARRQTSEGKIEDAVAVAQRIEDDTARVGVLVRLAGVALASNERVRATELLNEAEREALKAGKSLARSQALLTIVASFASFDALRAFEVMQTTVKSINANSTPPKEAGSEAPAGSPRGESGNVLKLDELYRLDFESTLSVLARSDFDRALLLAQQLSPKEASWIAQLAVCRGGLLSAPPEHSKDHREAPASQ